MLGGEGLQPTSTATTVRVRDGETITTDGPFAETREQLGGYYLLDCQDLDEAIALGRAHPRRATGGSVEVRPGHGLRGRRLRGPTTTAARRAALSAPGAAIDRLFRRESGQAVAALARAFGDLDRAEEAVQDAFVVALERWPRDGVPPTRRPGSRTPRATGRSTGCGARGAPRCAARRRSRGSRRSSPRARSPTSGSS